MLTFVRAGAPYTADIASPRAHPASRSRRAFLARLTAMLAAPVAPAALYGCRRRPSGGEDRARAEADEHGPTGVAARPRLPEAEPTIRVRILRVQDGREPLRIGEPGQWIALASIVPVAGPGNSTRLPRNNLAAVLHAPVEIRFGESGWSILDEKRFRPAIDGDDVLELRPLLPHRSSTLTVQERPHPGIVRLVPRVKVGSATAESRLLGRTLYDVVNHVALESYLPGVLAKELYNHWHLETHAAQAIAARSFAVCEHAQFGHRHYDLTNTALSQMYIGETTHERAVEAAHATRGLMLAYEDLLVPGYYSSCCGGVAADAIDAIGRHPFNDVPPLRGRSGADVCTEAPLFSWTVERSRRETLERLRAFGKARKIEALSGLKSVQEIRVSATNEHGRPQRFEIVTDGEAVHDISAKALRRALDFYTSSVPRPERTLFSSNVTATVNRTRIRFEGHGHGHGVGLCQYGAEALAGRGMTHEGILAWYYPGAEVVKAYA